MKTLKDKIEEIVDLCYGVEHLTKDSAVYSILKVIEEDKKTSFLEGQRELRGKIRGKNLNHWSRLLKTSNFTKPWWNYPNKSK